MHSTRRNCPLVVVLAGDASRTARVTAFWRGQGATVVRVRDDAGCLRVATAAGPDIIIVDSAASGRLLQLLRAHPVSGGAQIQFLAEDALPQALAAA